MSSRCMPRWACPGARRSCASGRSGRAAPAGRAGAIRGDLHCHRRGPMAGPHRGDGAGCGARLRVPGDLRSHARGRRGPGPCRRRCSAPSEEIPAANEVSRRSGAARGSSATSCPTVRSIFPTRCSRSSMGSGQRARRPADARREMTERVRRPCATRTSGASVIRPGRLPPPVSPENARRPRARLRGGASNTRSQLEVNGLAPRLDLSGEHVRDALASGRTARLLDRRALGRRTGEYGPVGGHRTTRVGHCRERRQHALAPGPALPRIAVMVGPV